MSWLAAISKRKNVIGRHRGVIPDAQQHPRAVTTEPVPADGARHSGYAPADHGSPVLGHRSQHDVGHSGYAPTDSTSPLVAHLHLGTPSGMAGKAGSSQGVGEVDDGLRHTGWAPTDGESDTTTTT